MDLDQQDRSAERSPSHLLRPEGWLVTAGLALITTLVGVRRLLWHVSFWRDEAATAQIIDRPWGDFTELLLRGEANMGPYYVAAKFWSLFDSSDDWLRTFSIVGGVVAVVLLHRAVCSWAGGTVAVVASAIMIVNPAFRAELTDARGYSWSIALTIAAAALAWRMARRPDGTPWVAVGLGAVTGIGVATNLVAVAVPVTVVAVLLVYERSTRLWRRVAVAAVSAVVCFAPFAPAYAAKNGQQVDWIEPISVAVVRQELFRNLLGGVVRFSFVLVGTAIAVAVLVAGGGQVRRRNPMIVACAAAAVVLPAGLVVVSVVKPLFIYRYMVPMVPMLAVTAAFGLTWAARRLRVQTAAAAVGLVVVAALLLAPNPLTATTDEDLRSIATEMEAEIEPGDIVLFHSTRVRGALGHYTDAYEAGDVAFEAWPDDAIIAVERPVPEVRGAVEAAPRVWLVFDQGLDAVEVVDDPDPDLGAAAGVLDTLVDRPVIDQAHYDSLGYLLLGPEG